MMNKEIQNYHEQGYVVLQDVFTKEEVSELSTILKTKTVEQLKSLLPQDAFDRLTNIGTDSPRFWSEIPAVQYINKLSGEAVNALKKDRIINALNYIIGPDVKCIQSIFFIKSPGSAGTPWHQDETYLPTRDKSLTAVWIALNEASDINGAVDIIPESHKSGILYNLDPTDLSRNIEKIGDFTIVDKTIQLCAKAGDVVFFNGYSLHSSGYNRSKNFFRESLVFHVMSANSLFPYRPGDNFNGLRKDPSDFRDMFMVSGNDPYDFKGLEDIYKPYIQRPKNIYYKP